MLPGLFAHLLCPRTPRPAPSRPRYARPHLEALEGREVPALVYGLTADNRLVKFDSAAPGQLIGMPGMPDPSVLITGLQTSASAERVVGIDFRPRTGQLIATTVPVGATNGALVRTYALDPNAGFGFVATFLGSFSGVPGAADVPTGADFNPTVDRLRLVNGNGENFRIDPNNGTLAGDDPNLTFVPPASGPIVAEAYDRNFDRPGAAAVPTTLYGIDAGSNRLVVQGGVNGSGVGGANGGIVTAVGSLGVSLDSGSDAGFDVAVGTANGGRGTAVAALTVGGVTGLYDVNLSTGAATLIGRIGDGTIRLTGLAIVPDGVIVAGAGPGASDVRLIDPATGQVRIGIVPFAGFQGGVRVAAGDVTGDGITDAVVAAVGPQGHVKVFDGLTGAEVQSFLTFADFGGTVHVAAGDVNRDGFDDVIVAADGVNGHVKAFSGRDGSLLLSFLAYDNYLGRVTVAAADLDNDGDADLVTAASVNGHVKVFDNNGAAYAGPAGIPSSFFSHDNFLGDVFVTAGDLNGDGVPDVAAVTGAPTIGHLKAFSGRDGSLLASYFTPNPTVGLAQVGSVASVGVADFDADGRYEVIVTPTVAEPGFTENAVYAYELFASADQRFGVVGTLVSGRAPLNVYPSAFRGGLTAAGARY